MDSDSLLKNGFLSFSLRLLDNTTKGVFLRIIYRIAWAIFNYYVLTPLSIFGLINHACYRGVMHTSLFINQLAYMIISIGPIRVYRGGGGGIKASIGSTHRPRNCMCLPVMCYYIYSIQTSILYKKKWLGHTQGYSPWWRERSGCDI